MEVCPPTGAVFLDGTIVNVALPTLAVDLDATTRQLQWIVDAYNLAFAALVLAGGTMWALLTLFAAEASLPIPAS